MVFCNHLLLFIYNIVRILTLDTLLKYVSNPFQFEKISIDSNPIFFALFHSLSLSLIFFKLIVRFSTELLIFPFYCTFYNSLEIIIKNLFRKSLTYF